MAWLAGGASDVAIVLALGIVALAAARKWLPSTLIAFGDHPGQFMRFWYALTVSLPGSGQLIDWNASWYAGYPELQFYPPGYVLLGVALNALTLGRYTPEFVYNLVAAVALVLPAFTFFAFLRYTLADLGRWPARIAGAAVAVATLGFDAMWGGTFAAYVGMLGERLAFGLGPLVLLAGWRLVERPGPARLALAAAALAAVVLMHPFHAPALVVAVAAYALIRQLMARNAARAPEAGPHRLWPWLIAWPLLSIAVVGWWLLPLVVNQSPYAGQLERANFAQILDWLRFGPVPWLFLASVAGFLVLFRPEVRPKATYLALAALPPVLVLWIVFDSLVLVSRLGFAAFDPIRFIAEYYMAALLLAGVGLAAALAALFDRAAPAHSWRRRLSGATALLLTLAALWQPVMYLGRELISQLRPGGIVTLAAVQANPAMSGLWQALRDDPAADGRVLFTSYYLQLPWSGGGEVATSIKALTPYFTGREILGGTFSHWGPIARLMWVGDPWARKLPERVEADDDARLLNRSWRRLTDAELYAFASAFNVSTIVAGPGDVRARAMLDAAPHFRQFWTNGSFTLYHVDAAQAGWVEADGANVTLLERTPGQWIVEVDSAQPGATLTARMAYYPLWRAAADGQALEMRPDALARQQVALPVGGPYQVTLSYRNGWAETLGALLTAGGLLLAAFLLLLSARRRARPGTGI